MTTVLAQNVVFGTERRTVLRRFWSENCIECQNLSKTLLHAYKPHFIITNDVPNTHVRFLSITHRLASVYSTVEPRSHPVRDTLILLGLENMASLTKCVPGYLPNSWIRAEKKPQLYTFGFGGPRVPPITKTIADMESSDDLRSELCTTFLPEVD